MRFRETDSFFFSSTDKGDPRTFIPPCVMAWSAMELQLGVFGFLPTTHTETNTNKMCPRSSRAVRRFTHVYVHAQITVHAHLANHSYFDRGKNLNTPIGAPCLDEDGAGSGISTLFKIHTPLVRCGSQIRLQLSAAGPTNRPKPKVIKQYSYTPRTLRACCSQSKFRILEISESSARALFLYNCTPNISRSANASVSIA